VLPTECNLPETRNPTLVSVIIPTYNRNGYLKEAIESCIAQTYRPIECIIVDDGSTDGTQKLIEGLQTVLDESFFLKYIYQNNAGSQVARNTGSDASTGEFIQYLDSDDLLYPKKIERQVAFLREYPGCDAVWGDWAKGTKADNIIIRSVARQDLLTQMLTEHCIVNFSFLMRRAIVEKIGLWDIKIKRNQEIDFQVRGLLAGAKYEHQPQIGGLWRIHDGDRIANTTGAKEFLLFYRKWERILVERRLFNQQMRVNIANIYIWLVNSNSDFNQENLALLQEVVRLNPEINITQKFTMKILRKFLGLNLFLKFWLLKRSFN